MVVVVNSSMSDITPRSTDSCRTVSLFLPPDDGDDGEVDVDGVEGDGLVDGVVLVVVVVGVSFCMDSKLFLVLRTGVAAVVVDDVF